MKKFIFLVLLLIACLISPVMAESGTINYDYTKVYSESQSQTAQIYNANVITVDRLATNDLKKMNGFKSMITTFPAAAVPYNTFYPDQITVDSTVTFYYAGQSIGTGVYQWTRTGTNNYVLSVIADNGLDLTGYSGAGSITMTAEDSDIFLLYHYAGVSPTAQYGIIAGIFKSYPNEGTKFCPTYRAVTYYHNEIHQSITYDYDAVLNNMDISIIKNGYTSKMLFTDNNGVIRYDKTNAQNEDFTIYSLDYLVLDVTNPITSDIWTNTIPETSTPGPVYDSIIHMSVYDAVTRNLINGHNVTLQYDDNSPIFTTWDGPISHTSIDWFNGQAANVTYSAEGYDPSPTHRYVMSVVDLSGQWLKAGESRTGNVYLNPIAPPSNVTAYAIFDVLEDMPNGNTFYSSGAAVTIGNTTLITAGQGSCSFELSPGNYQYIVKKVGYQTVSGSFVLGASNKYITVNLPKVQTAPTAPQPTGTAGVDYPYKEVNAREQAESSMGIIFDALPGFASLAVIVLVVSFVGWMTPKKRR